MITLYNKVKQMGIVLGTIQKIILYFRQERPKFFCPRTKAERKKEDLAIKEMFTRANMKHKV